jgi:4-hydroxybenzoyl-CoA reductase subunit beta
MMRLPSFTYLAPRGLTEAADQLARHQPDALVVAGGTDLLPNMKRRQQQPKVVIGLRLVAELRGIAETEDGGLRIGAMMPLAALAGDPRLAERYPALAVAANLVSTPHLRRMGTFGGNLCLDTRCTYYDQSYHWRESIDFCMKCPDTNSGAICWVAPESPRCWAVSSADTAPVAVALGARLRLVSVHGERTLDAGAFFRDDGIHYLDRRPDEILADAWFPSRAGWRMTYLKLRRRGSFDFPVLGVAAAVKLSDGAVEQVRLVLGSVGSAPVDVSEAAAPLVGTTPTPAAIEAIAATAWRGARPLDNTDLHYAWRKKMARVYVRRALAEVCAA